GGGVTAVIGARIAVVADERRSRGAGAVLAGLDPVAGVAVAAARSVWSLGIRGARTARPGAGLSHVAGARGRPAQGARRGEDVRRTGSARSRAGLGHVAHACGRPAERARGGQDVRRAGRAGSRARLGDVTRARGGAADRPGSGELAATGAAGSAVAR